MGLRIKSGKALIFLGEFIKSLAVVMMNPDNLIEFGRRSYSKPGAVSSFSDRKLLEDGLCMDEERMLKNTSLKSGKILVLGVGGGREAIALAKMGYEVTGTDFVEEMCNSALRNGEKAGVKFNVVTQEMSAPDFPPGSFDIAWLSVGMYSSIPSRKKRISFLKQINSILKPGGYFILQFHWQDKKKFSPVKETLKGFLGIIFFGNFRYETGDSLWRDKEFLHFFHDEKLLRSELNESGMDINLLEIPDLVIRGNAVLHKRENGKQ